jgi:hypothetical protein
MPSGVSHGSGEAGGGAAASLRSKATVAKSGMRLWGAVVIDAS